MTILAPNASEFKAMLAAKKTFLADFYATWCGPCKMLSPIIDEVAKQYEGRVDVYKVNVDEEPELADAFNIRSIPTLYFIPVNGKPKMTVGGMSKADLLKQIQAIL